VRKEKIPRAREKLVALVKESGALDAALHPQRWRRSFGVASSVVRFFLDYDPLPNLKTVSCPVLALYGQKDLQVSAKAIAVAAESAARLDEHSSGKQNSRAESPLQHALGLPPKPPSKKTFSPEALALIVDWVRVHSFSK